MEHTQQRVSACSVQKDFQDGEIDHDQDTDLEELFSDDEDDDEDDLLQMFIEAELKREEAMVVPDEQQLGKEDVAELHVSMEDSVPLVQGEGASVSVAVNPPLIVARDPEAGPEQAEEMHRAAAQVEAPSEQMLRKGFWGIFRITPKQPSTKAGGGGKFGGWQATCPYHAKSQVTGCRKYVGIRAPGLEAKQVAFLRLAHWCSLAPSCATQAEHLVVPLDPVPDQNVIKTRIITALPDNHVMRTDEELAAQAQPGHPDGPGSGKTGLGKGKGHQQSANRLGAHGRGRGGSRAKGKGLLA